MTNCFICKTLVIAYLCLVAVPTSADSPWKTLTADAVTPAEALLVRKQVAKGFLASKALRRLSVTGEESPPEILELLRGVDNDPLLLLQHMQQNVDLEPYFGHRRSPVSCLKQRRCNDLDQAVLLATALNAAGVSAVVSEGVMAYSGLELESWLGETVPYAQQMLSANGIPWEFVGRRYQVHRFWVTAIIDGAETELDPAFQVLKGRPAKPLADVIDFDVEQYISEIRRSGNVSSSSVQGIDYGIVKEAYERATQAILDAADNQFSEMSLNQLLGRAISLTPLQTNLAAGLGLPYEKLNSFSEIPESLVATLTLGIADETLRFAFSELEGSTLAIAFPNDDPRPEVWLNGDRIWQGAAISNDLLELISSVDLPLAADNGNYGDGSERDFLPVGSVSSINLIHTSARQRDYASPYNTRLMELGEAGADDSDTEVIAGRLALLAQHYGQQNFLAWEFLTNTLGLGARAEYFFAITSVRGRSTSLDVSMAAVSVWTTNDWQEQNEVSSAGITAWTVGSALEHSIFEQGYGGEVPGVSTVKGITKALRSGQRVAFANAATEASLATEVASFLSRTGGSASAYDRYIAEGGFLFFPTEQTTIGGWRGDPYLSAGPEVDGVASCYCLSPSRTNGGEDGVDDTVEEILTEIDNLLEEWLNSEEDFDNAGDSWELYPNPYAADPVDLATGYMVVEQSALALGTGDLPSGLNFLFRYNSGKSDADGPLGFGWSHAFESSVRRISAPELILGGRGIRDAASALAYMHLTKEVQAALIGNPYGKPDRGYTDDALGWSLTMLAASWLSDQFVGNAVRVQSGNYFEVFTQQSNNDFVAQPLNRDRLSVLSDGSYVLVSGQEKEYRYNKEGQLTSIADKYGREAILGYDGSLLTSVQEHHGRSYLLSYNVNQYLVELEDSTGRSIAFEYDANSNLSAVVGARGNRTSYTYDDQHNLLTSVDAENNQLFSNTYDAHHRVETQILPTDSGEVAWNFYYSDFRNTEEAPDGRRRVYQFDRSGRVTATIEASGEQVNQRFDELGQMIERRTSSGGWVKFEYENGFLTRSETDFGLIKRLERDASGRITKEFEDDLLLTSTEYDDAGDIISLTDRLGATTQFSRDEYGRVNKQTDAFGVETVIKYDAFGNAISTSTGIMGTQASVFDAIGNLLSFETGEGVIWRWTYDDERNVTSVVDPSGYRETRVFDHRNRLVEVTRRNGEVETREYSLDGQIKTVSLNGMVTAKYERNSVGQVVSKSNANGVITVDYDANGRVRSRTGVNGQRHEYRYDHLGRLSRQTLPGGLNLEFSFEDRSKVSEIKTWWGDRYRFAYDARGALASKVLVDGSRTTYELDSAGRALSQRTVLTDGTPLSSYTIGRDQLGNVISVLADEPARSPLRDGIVNNQFEAGKLAASTSVDEVSTDTYSYDLEGRLVTRSDGLTVYYGDDYLVSSLGGVVDVELQYDVDGNLIASKAGGREWRYAFNDAGQLTTILDQNNALLGSLLHTNGLLGYVSAEGDILSFHYDYRGNVIAVTDDAGNIVNSYSYSPFGRLLSKREKISLPFRFAAKYGALHLADDFYLMGARVYDASQGRFISPDPLGLAGGQLSLYTYAHNNPLKYVDPTGFVSQEAQDWGQVAGYVAAAVLGGAALFAVSAATIGTAALATIAAISFAIALPIAVSGINEMVTTGSLTKTIAASNKLDEIFNPVGSYINQQTGGIPITDNWSVDIPFPNSGLPKLDDVIEAGVQVGVEVGVGLATDYYGDPYTDPEEPWSIDDGFTTNCGVGSATCFNTLG